MADHTGAPVPSTGYLGSGPVSASFRFLKGCVALTITVSQHPTLKLCPVPMTPTQSNGAFPRTTPLSLPPESAIIAMPPAPPLPPPPPVLELASATLDAPPAELTSMPPTPLVGEPDAPEVVGSTSALVLSPQ